MGKLRNNLNFPSTPEYDLDRNTPTPWRIPLIPGSLNRMMCWSVEGTEGIRCRMRIGGVINWNCQYSRHLNHRMKTVELRRRTILASDMIGETGDCLTRGSDYPRRKAQQSEWNGQEFGTVHNSEAAIQWHVVPDTILITREAIQWFQVHLVPISHTVSFFQRNDNQS